MNYTIIVFAENTPQAVYKIIGILVRRKINIEKLTVVKEKTNGTSKAQIDINSNKKLVETISKQIERIIEVTKVEYKESL